MKVFTQLLDDYKQCLLNQDFSDAAAARIAVIAEYEQVARRASVMQMPQWDGVIKPTDFIVDTFHRRSSGWIPQPDNGVRITHRPTGLFEEEVSMRSVYTNKAVAWQRLTDRLEALIAALQPPKTHTTRNNT